MNLEKEFWGKNYGHINRFWQKVKVSQLHPTLCDPMCYTVHGILQDGTLELDSLSFLQGVFPTQFGKIKPRSPTLQAGSLPAEPQGKPNFGRVGLKNIFKNSHIFMGKV